MEMQRINMDVPKALWRHVKIRAAEEGRLMREIVVEALEKYLEGAKVMMCEICDANGQVTPATRRVLGKDACPECAAELEGSLQIGPAIWMVEVISPWPQTDPMADDLDADYGTVDAGHFTLGYRDRAAAERYAAEVGAEVREGYIVEIVGGSEPDALEAAGFTDWAGFDGPVGVVWPHDDEDGLRRRLLYGADA